MTIKPEQHPSCRTCRWFRPDPDHEWGECRNVVENNYSMAILDPSDDETRLIVRADFACDDWDGKDDA